MKKIGLFSLLFICLLLVGCSSTKRVVCNQKVSVIDVDMIMDFKDDVISYMGLKYTMDLSSYSDEQINLIKEQNICDTVKQSMSAYADAFTNCKQNIDNKKLLVTADFDIDKIPGSAEGKKESMDQAIKELEAQGYTCNK